MLGCSGPEGEDPEWQSAGLLFELRGGGIGNKSRGKIVNICVVGLWSVIDSVASGAIDEVDPDRWDDVPLKGDRIDTSDKFPNWPED